jgi:hypothetical protein
LPHIFDGAVSSCAEFVSSAAPSSLSDVTPLENFCTDIGNVLGGGSAVATGTGSNGSPVVTKTTGGGSTTVKKTATSTPGVAATIATPVATTIQQTPTTSTKSNGASGMQGEGFRTTSCSDMHGGLGITQFFGKFRVQMSLGLSSRTVKE